ncbi:MAG: hypothetical protein JWM77_1948 [Rhodospirillales bacterium]|jgi:hypothetical protein|nr:hypothetical protein [Rhodospirillales bacterium]
MNRMKRAVRRPGMRGFPMMVIGALAAYGWITIARALFVQITR